MDKKPLTGCLALLLFTLIPVRNLTAQGSSTCTYRLIPDAAKVTWTAFKFTEKTGVKGTFDSVRIRGTRSAKSPEAAIAGLKFAIATESVNSNNADRDAKIRKHFFGSLKTGDRIKGSVKSWDPAAESGVVLLTLGGVTRPVTMKTTLTGEDLRATANLNLADFAALPGITALNKVCEELHKGKDGKSVLWPEADIQIDAKFEKKCRQ